MSPEANLRELLDSGLAAVQAFKTRTLDGTIRRYYYRRTYGKAAPNPFQVIYIDPDAVKHVVAPGFQSSHSRWGTYVIDGDWSRVRPDDRLMFAGRYESAFTPETRRTVPFESYGFYQSCLAHFNEGTPWEETAFYEWLIQNQEKSIMRYETRETIATQLAVVDDLYETIKTEGYKSQTELGTSRWKPDSYDEVLVDIGRDGQFILDDGRHRLTLAKIIGVESIPVRVFVRHTEWQQHRYEYSNGTVSEPASHPDLRSI